MSTPAPAAAAAAGPATPAPLLDEFDEPVKPRSPHNSPLNVVGRFLLATVFVTAGATKFFALQPKYAAGDGDGVVQRTMQPLVRASEQLSAYTGRDLTIPKVYYRQVVTSIAVVEGMGGFLFVQNHKFGAVLLILLSLPMTFLAHQWWSLEPGTDEYDNHLSHFFKNIALVGGLLCFIATSDGEPLRTNRKHRLDLGERIALGKEELKRD